MSEKLGLSSAVGVEIEYMLVHPDTLEIQSNCDLILSALAGETTNYVECGEISLSNELVRHVIELKMTNPQALTEKTHAQFHHALTEVLAPTLSQFNTKLLPTGTHPWLNPDKGVELWPHGDKEIYHTFDRIFGCCSHGFANLQSVHLNLPFANDDEFYQLHSAIRPVLALIPALCASTPFIEGKKTGAMDSRLQFYKSNQRSIPIVTGDIIPEQVNSIEAYHQVILEKIYDALRPHDPKGVLCYEWVNSRGAIARFERDAIEIRVMDSQECPLADLTCVAIINGILKHMVTSQEAYLKKPLPTGLLKAVFDVGVEQGLAGTLPDKRYLQAFEIASLSKMRFDHLLSVLIEQAADFIPPVYLRSAELLLEQGNLAQRLVKATQENLSTAALRAVYQQLSNCLYQNEMFLP